MVQAPSREDAAVLAGRVARDPLFFAREILGHDLWLTGEAILQALAKPRARVAVKGCHASSKTFSAAEAVLWTPFAGGIAITTAPTARQVGYMVWGEVHQMYPRSRHPLGGNLWKTAHFEIAPDLYAVGLSTDKGVNFAGFHARYGGFMLIVLDEAPGVPPSVYDAIEGVRAGGDVRVLALGNPDVPSGPFYESFTSQRAGWECFTIDAFASPNFEDEERGGFLTLESLLALPEYRLDYAPRPYLITRRFAREKYDEWGLASPLWQSKVRGQFPDQSADSLISLAWIEAAKRREIELDPAAEWAAGIDVAGPGEDETAVGVRCGPVHVAQAQWAEQDPRGKVLAFLEPYRERLKHVNVDSIGQGYYFAKHLEDNGYRGKVRYVNVGSAPTVQPSNRPDDKRMKYANLKAELYWSLRERFRENEIAGITDEMLISQLAGIRYGQTSTGKTEIESKEDARRRGVKSPDRAEMLMLEFAPGPRGFRAY